MEMRDNDLFLDYQTVELMNIYRPVVEEITGPILFALQMRNIYRMQQREDGVRAT